MWMTNFWRLFLQGSSLTGLKHDDQPLGQAVSVAQCQKMSHKQLLHACRSSLPPTGLTLFAASRCRFPLAGRLVSTMAKPICFWCFSGHESRRWYFCNSVAKAKKKTPPQNNHMCWAVTCCPHHKEWVGWLSAGACCRVNSITGLDSAAYAAVSTAIGGALG